MLKNNLLPKKNGVIFIMEEKSGQGYVGTMWGDCKSVNYTVQDLLGEKQKFDLKYQILEYDEGWNSMKKLVGTWEVEKVIKEHEKSIVLDGGSLLATKVVIKNGKVASALSFSFYPW